MGSCSCCARILLISINIFIVIIGLVLLVIGCLLRYEALDFLNEHIMDLLSSVGTSDATETGVAEFGSLIGSISLGLIISGCIIFGIGFLGMCGACCKVRWMLILFAVITGLIILVQVIGVILLYSLTDELDAFIKKSLRGSLTDQYEGSTGTGLSVAWNYMFVELKCCGVDHYKDTHSAKKWNRLYTRPDNNQLVTLETPITCCKLTGTFPNYNQPTNYDCAVTPTVKNSNFATSCFSALVEQIQSVEGYLIGIGVVILIIELLLFSSAIYVAKDEHDKIHPLKN